VIVKRCKSRAAMSVISIRAKLLPMQARGPAPNGR
jgi:hypothetical protein